MTDLCNAQYERVPLAGPPGVVHILKCQYIKDHPADRHSWYAIHLQDIEDKAAYNQRVQAEVQAVAGDSEVKDILDRIVLGYYDTFIEAILNAAHNRKRTVRGMRGFPNLERRGRRSA